MTEPLLLPEIGSPGLVEAGLETLVANAQRLGLLWGLRPATVLEGGTSTVEIIYDGDSVPIQAVNLVGPIAAGIRVMCISVPPGGNFVVGFRVFPGFVDGVTVTTSAALVSAVSAETTITQLNLSGQVLASYVYLVGIQMRSNVTVTGDDWEIRVRRDTALTGALLFSAQWSGDGLVGTRSWFWPYFSTADETLDLFFSVARAAGAGTITVFGSPGAGVLRTSSYLAMSAPTSLWRTT